MRDRPEPTATGALTAPAGNTSAAPGGGFGYRLAAALVLAACFKVPAPVAAPEPEQILVASARDSFPTQRAPYRQQLIGLYVDGEERTGMFAYVRQEDYLVPLEAVLDSIGAELRETGDQREIVTPAGTAVLEPHWLRRTDDEELIFVSALGEALMVGTEFDQAAYALRLTLPWWLDDSPARVREAIREAQFSPPAASLSTLRADLSYFHSDQRDDLWAEYLAAGNLAGGLWQARAAQTRSGDVRPFDYYWLKSSDSSQLLVGNALFNLHPLLPVVEQTGVQALYSNRRISQANALSLSTASGNRSIGSSARRITGTGEPGSIAELRVNGGVVDRVRVRLDGSFEFTGVDLAGSGYSEIKVLLLDRNSGVLTETLDYSRRVGAGLLEAGQITLFSALGEQGNPLDSHSHSLGNSGALQARYGVTEGLSVDLGAQHDGNDVSAQVGSYLSLGGSWFAGINFADGPTVDSTELTLEGGREHWEFSFSAREFDVDQPGQEARQWVRFGHYRHHVSDRLTLGLAGRDARTSYQDRSYLLPTVSWSNGHSINFSAWPNIDGRYRLDTRVSPSRRDTVRYTYEDGNHLLDYRHRTAAGLEYYGLYRDGDNFEGRYESGVILYGDTRAFDRLQAGLVALGGEFGYNLQLDSRLLPGVYSRLRVSENALIVSTLEADPGLTVQWDLTFDFAFSGGRFTAADSNFAANTAALSGPLLLDGEPLGHRNKVSRVVVVVDGISHTAAVQGSTYYIDGLSPGLHRVTIDSRYLPLEMRPAGDQVFWVQLARGAATRVPFTLEVSYAVAGKLVDRDGVALADRSIRILAAGGEQHAVVRTDTFGTYRADGLPPGRYRAVLGNDGTTAVDFLITDEFLFGVDITAP